MYVNYFGIILLLENLLGWLRYPLEYKSLVVWFVDPEKRDGPAVRTLGVRTRKLRNDRKGQSSDG
jgi:hypothetical protein